MKFTIFALFYFVFEGNFQVQAPRGAYIGRGDLTEGFLRYEFGGLYLGGGGLYMEGLIFGILRYIIYYRSNPLIFLHGAALLFQYETSSIKCVSL